VSLVVVCAYLIWRIGRTRDFGPDSARATSSVSYLDELSRIIRTEAEGDDLLRAACDPALSHTAAVSVSVCAVDEHPLATRLVARTGSSTRGQTVGGMLLDSPAISRCLSTNEAVVLGPSEIEPAIRDLTGVESRAVMILPVRRFGRAFGCIVAGFDDPQAPSPQDHGFLTLLAGVVATTAWGARSHGIKLRGALDCVKAVSGALSGLGPQTPPDEVRKVVVSSTCEALGCDAVALLTIDQYMGGVECEISDPRRENLRPAMVEMLGRFLADIDRTEAWVRADLAQVCADDDEQLELFAAEGIRGIVAAPINSNTGARGALIALYTEPIVRPSQRGALVEAVASQVAGAISHALAIEQSNYLVDDLVGENQELSVQATNDGLTGLTNHRALQQKLSELCRASSARNRRVFSLIMADVDHFKAFNDTYGHQEGDAVLRQVASTMLSYLGRDDTAARYGGEEFAIVLHGVSKDNALAIAERIRCAVSERQFSSSTVTISMGIAEFPADGATPGEIIDRADRALYQAKVTGRNRVVVWGSGGLAQEDMHAGPDSGVVTMSNVLVVNVCHPSESQAASELQTRGEYTVAVCDSVCEATGLLRSQLFDIVLVDTGDESIPDSDSIGALSLIRPDMPVVVLTGVAEMEIIRGMVGMGVCDVVAPQCNLPLLIEQNMARKRSERRRMRLRTKALVLQAAEAFSAILETRAESVAVHSKRVTSLALSIADRLNLSRDDRFVVELAARLHDLGKVGVPDSAMDRRTPLAEQEWKAVREHPALGSRILGVIDDMACVGAIIRHHHERLDGSGYPDGLAGPQIPLLSQILSVADAYEFLSAERAKRARLSPKEAIRELRQHAGTYYSSEIIDALEAALRGSGEIRNIQGSKAA